MAMQETFLPVDVPDRDWIRFGGSGGGGGERRGGGDFSPKEVARIFELLLQVNESYFGKDSPQPIAESAVRRLNSAVFGAIAGATADKARLMTVLQSMADQADDERLARGSRLSVEQMGDLIDATIEKIRDCFFGPFPGT